MAYLAAKPANAITGSVTGNGISRLSCLVRLTGITNYVKWVKTKWRCLK